MSKLFPLIKNKFVLGEYSGVPCNPSPILQISDNLINDKLGFIVRRLDSWTKDVESDRFLEFSNHSPSSDKYYHFYLKTGEAQIYTSEDGQVNDLIQSFYLTNNYINQIKLEELFMSIQDYTSDRLPNYQEKYRNLCNIILMEQTVLDYSFLF